MLALGCAVPVLLQPPDVMEPRWGIVLTSACSGLCVKTGSYKGMWLVQGDVTGKFVITKKQYFTAIWTLPMAVKYPKNLKIRSV